MLYQLVVVFEHHQHQNQELHDLLSESGNKMNK